MLVVLSSPSDVGGSGAFLSQETHGCEGYGVLASDADKQCGWRMPTIVLSETRGLWLFLVVRGGIGLIKRLAVLEAHIRP